MIYSSIYIENKFTFYIAQCRLNIISKSSVL